MTKAIGGKPNICFLPKQLMLTPKQSCSDRESITKPFDWEADTLPLSYRLTLFDRVQNQAEYFLKLSSIFVSPIKSSIRFRNIIWLVITSTTTSCVWNETLLSTLFVEVFVEALVVKILDVFLDLSGRRHQARAPAMALERRSANKHFTKFDHEWLKTSGLNLAVRQTVVMT